MLLLWAFSCRPGRPSFRFPVQIRFSDLWKWEGSVNRGTYAFVGVAGFAIKHNIDRIIATAVFGRRFTIFNYWIPPIDAVRISSLSDSEARFLTTMVLVSLPFVWIGLSMTVRRLRSANLPLWLLVLFFVPFLNLAFFAVLSFIPGRNQGDGRQEADARTGALSSIIPSDPVGSAAIAAILTGIIGGLAAYVGVQSLGVYGWGVFVALPFCLGMASVLIYTYHEPRPLLGCVLVSAISVLIVGILLFAFAVEGIICLLMAIPVATPLAILGGMFGYLLQRGGRLASQSPMMLLLAIMPIAATSIEKTSRFEPPESTVQTTIVIRAPVEKVWHNLIAFTDLPQSDEWLFRLGVSQPIRAVIDGTGVGALRQCLFTTGTFVERVEAWEENRYFAFSVVSGAEAMREFSPYDIRPRHLEGYFVPENAEFHLISNDDGTITLSGTSRYRNAMWPAPYWRLWSDMIIHQVHLQVFEHIRKLSETNAG